MSKFDGKIVLNDIDYDIVTATLNIVTQTEVKVTATKQIPNMPGNLTSAPLERKTTSPNKNFVIEIFEALEPMPQESVDFQVSGKLSEANVNFKVTVRFDQLGGMSVSIPPIHDSST